MQGSDDLADLVHAARTAEVPLCQVDEAGLLAVGWVPPARAAGSRFAGSAAPTAFPGLAQAQERLVAAGLARRAMTDLPVELTPTGRLADYLVLVSRDRLATATWVNGTAGEQTGERAGGWRVRRLTLLRSAPVVVVERVASDVPDPAQPLPVAIVLAGVEAVADELVALAFRPPVQASERQSAAGTESLYVGPDRKAAEVPSLLVHRWDEPTGELRWRRMSLFARRTERDRLGGRVPLTLPRVTPADYRAHLLSRMSAAELSGPGAR